MATGSNMSFIKGVRKGYIFLWSQYHVGMGHCKASPSPSVRVIALLSGRPKQCVFFSVYLLWAFA